MFFCNRNNDHHQPAVSGYYRAPHTDPNSAEQPNAAGYQYQYDPSLGSPALSPYQAHFYNAYHDDRQRLRDARELADVIGKRNFEGKIMPSASPLGYSLLLGGATFFALSFPAMMIARPISRAVGRRAAYGGLKLLTTLTAGSMAVKYYQRKQTLEDLKVMGTYLSPNENSPSADALSCHPLVDRAIYLEAQKQKALSPYGADPYHSVYSHGGVWFPNSSMNRQILDEYKNVLAHCEERRSMMGLSNPAIEQAAVVETVETPTNRRGGRRHSN